VRQGVDRGDGQLGLCRVPTPDQVQDGVAVDVDGVGELTVTGNSGLNPWPWGIF